uniref:Uncharacterized protein n=1 Tax=Tanacetum cinerariifolium TaxID=118510 RepID=A0A699JLP8_TANCI|nr:hypothetical protein [Tanacetum cinerariifolium]
MNIKFKRGLLGIRGFYNLMLLVDDCQHPKESLCQQEPSLRNLQGYYARAYKHPKNSRKAQIQIDEKLDLRLHKEEKAKLERMKRDRSAQEEASNAALTVEFNDVQARVDADALGKKDDSSQKQAKSIKKIPRAEHDEESVKKHKLEDDTKKEELRDCLDIVPGDDFAINVESLATKYTIVD